MRVNQRKNKRKKKVKIMGKKITKEKKNDIKRKLVIEGNMERQLIVLKQK